MVIKRNIVPYFITLLLAFLQSAGLEVYAQEVKEDDSRIITRDEYIEIEDSLAQKKIERENATPFITAPVIEVKEDSELPNDTIVRDSLRLINRENLELIEAPIDTTGIAQMADSLIVDSLIIVESGEPVRKFIPNPTRSIWLATVIPGGGQIYNRKYWKLPIVYGGFVGCAYAITWNNKMYNDYSQAYLDIMDNDPNTNSFEDIFPPSLNWSDDTKKNYLKNSKDKFRRWRDLSIFCTIGVYLISIIDAYVDAELSDFDISTDLGLKIEPKIMYDRQTGNSFGLQCSIKF